MVDLARRRRAYQVFARYHTRLLLRTRGRPSYLSYRLRCLVLVTTGRRTGQPRPIVLAYLDDGGVPVVLASNFGQEHPPAWWVNLQADPVARVQIAGTERRVRARLTTGNERDELLARAAAHNKQWRTYAATLERQLPVVRLEPDPDGP